MTEESSSTAGRPALLTGVAVSVAALAGVLQYAFPPMIPLLQRDADALARGEWWRLITPLLVQTLGWYQLLPNLVTLALFGSLVERMLGRRWWLTLSAAGTVAGQAAAYAWSIGGGGDSLMICGLAGGLLVFLLDRPLPPFAVLTSVGYVAALAGWGLAGPLAAVGGVAAGALFWALRRASKGVALDRPALAVALACGALLTLRHDLHGASLVAGAVTASLGIVWKARSAA